MSRVFMWNFIISGLIIFLPFQFATNLFPGADTAVFRLAVFVIGVLCLFCFLWEKKVQLPSRGTFVRILLALISIFVSCAIAGQWEWAVRKGFFLINFLLWYGILNVLLSSGKISKKVLVKSVVGSGSVVAMVGIFQWMGQFVFGLEPMLFFWREYVAPFFLGDVLSESVLEYSSWLVSVGGYTIFRAIAIFPDPHMFAFFLELCLPWALFSFLKTKNKIYLFVSIVMLLGIGFSFSRGAYLGLIVGFLCTGFIMIRNKKNIFQESLFLGTFFLFGLMFLLGTQNFVKDRLEDTFLNVDSSGEERLFLWGHAWGILLDHPIFGVGLGGYPETVQPSATYRDPIYAHNLYLDIGTEMGFFGIGLWLFAIFWAIRHFLLMGKENVLFFGGVVSLVIFSVHGIFDTPLYSVHVLGLFCVILAIAGKKLK